MTGRSDEQAVLLDSTHEDSDHAEPRQALADAHDKFPNVLARRLEAKYLQESDAQRKQLQEDLQKKAAELEALGAQHRAAQAEWESMPSRQDRDSKLFTFTVQGCEGPGLSGCLPRQIFDAEPTSALAHMCHGEWQYSTDDRGRAVINSEPAHWPIIVRWLSFGTVPSNPTQEFISECRYWQLDRLIEAINSKSVSFELRRVIADGSYGFTAETDISNFRERLEQAPDASSRLVLPFKAVGRDWSVLLHQKSIDIHMANGSTLQVNALAFVFGVGSCQWRKYSPGSFQGTMKKGGLILLGWDLCEKDVEQLMHPNLMSLDGSMHLAFTVTFKQ